MKQWIFLKKNDNKIQNLNTANNLLLDIFS